MLGTIAVLGALWLILIDQLRLDWSTNPQYSYGWLVPLLALYLFWQRWATRLPAARPTQDRWLVLTGGALALCFFPTRLIREATPEWSAVSWALALEVVGLTLVAIAWMGGWRALRHFAWPVGFFLVAVAWPVRFETALTQSLMQHLAAATAEILNFAGVSAAQEGNLIRLSVGVVGVDEACSGVRSLQSMLMAALFLGELNRLSWMARGALVLIGLALAVVFNVARALLLVTIALRQGLPELARWHDPAGFSILAISFVALCLVARLFQTKTKPASMAPSASSWRPLPLPWIAGLVLWLIAVEGTTEAWYRAHEKDIGGKSAWIVRWPETRPQFRDRAIDSNVRKMLAYNEGRQSSWEGADGSRWLVFFFRWAPARTSTLSARQHRPEVCLPASGRVLREERAVKSIQVGEWTLPFRSYVFEADGQPLHVFFCLWEMGNRDLARGQWRQDYSRASRLQRVFSGQRNLGQQSLEVIISGVDSPEEADTIFQRQMADMLAPAVP
jgi:exosortase